ncbi:MAG: hypothetical protein ACFE8V_06855 [Promethearchaeota archaeon]
MSVCKQKTFDSQVFLENQSNNEIPDGYIIDINFDNLRPIARRQIYSLLKRRQLTKRYRLYNKEINRVIFYEINLNKKMG